MIKRTYEKVNEEIYIEKLKNGIEVYLYKTDKTKNFYITISVKYGASVTKYKVGKRVVDVIPGSAHFLEHKVMALSENPEISKRINDLGSLANAWTSYDGTNYNIFGSINLIENLKLLLDIFYNTDINEKNVSEEKGIIGEEIDMYKDRIDSLLNDHLYKNLFNNSYIRNTVVGERSDIEKITAKSLNQIYNDYYIPNNTFITVCGNFDIDEVMDVINEYMDKLNLKPKTLPKRIKEKESEKVNVPYEEVTKDLEEHRVKYSLKMNKKIFGIKDDNILKDYIVVILSNNFSPTSKLFEEYKLKELSLGINYGVNTIDDMLIINITAVTKKPNEFIKNIKNDIRKLKITKSDFERKKKKYVRNYILSFENIEDIEYDIALSLMIDGKINFHEYSDCVNAKYEEALRVLSLINYDNECIIKTIK